MMTLFAPQKPDIKLLRKLLAKTPPIMISFGSYSGWYSIRDEAFFAEKELITSSDGRRLAPGGAEVEWIEEPSYFFVIQLYG